MVLMKLFLPTYWQSNVIDCLMNEDMLFDPSDKLPVNDGKKNILMEFIKVETNAKGSVQNNDTLCR